MFYSLNNVADVFIYKCRCTIVNIAALNDWFYCWMIACSSFIKTSLGCCCLVAVNQFFHVVSVSFSRRRTGALVCVCNYTYTVVEKKAKRGVTWHHTVTDTQLCHLPCSFIDWRQIVCENKAESGYLYDYSMVSLNTCWVPQVWDSDVMTYLLHYLMCSQLLWTRSASTANNIGLLHRTS